LFHHGGGYYAQPMMPMAPVAPITPLQILQGLQLLHGFGILLHDQRAGDGDRTPPPHCTVTQDVVDSLKRIDDNLDDVVKKTNLLTAGDPKDKKFKGFRDPKYQDEVSKPVEV